MIPFFACLCPTYFRPSTLAEAIACFHAQQVVSAESARLFICDDSGVYGDGQLHFPRITFDSSSTRFDSLPTKYNTMAERALNYHRWLLDTSPTPVGPLVFVVWEDDDIYLPDHLSRLAQSWELDGPFAWAHPDRVGSDYPGRFVEEGAGGRFHAALAISGATWQKCPWVETGAANFDQIYMGQLKHFGGRRNVVTPGTQPTYIFRWHTGHTHGQTFMRSPEDSDWYSRFGATATNPAPGTAPLDLRGYFSQELREHARACGWNVFTAFPDGVPHDCIHVAEPCEPEVFTSAQPSAPAETTLVNRTTHG